MVRNSLKIMSRLRQASPFETLIAFGLLIIGILFLFATLSTVLSVALPIWVQVAWIIWLISGSSLDLIGIAFGWARIRAMGLQFMGGALSVYTTATIAGAHGGFPLVAILTASIALAALLKSRRTP